MDRPKEEIVRKPFWGPRYRLRIDGRLAWGCVALLCGAVLGLAIYLHPDSRGFGTHEQLPFYPYPCSFTLTTGLPCPTCGMTTAFSLVMHGRFLAAFLAQPAGMVLCLGTVVLFVYAAYVAVSGMMIPLNRDRFSLAQLTIGLGLLILGGWGFKIAFGLATGSLPLKCSP